MFNMNLKLVERSFTSNAKETPLVFSNCKLSGTLERKHSL